MNRFFVVFLFCALPAAAQDYFPRDSGARWIYQLTNNGVSEMSSGTMTINALGDTVSHGLTFLRQQMTLSIKLSLDSTMSIDTSVLMYLYDDGKRIFEPVDKPDTAGKTLYGNHAYVAGEYWVNGPADTSAARFLGSITCRLGAVSNCWGVFHNDTIQYVFGPNIGPLLLFDQGDTLFNLSSFRLSKTSINPYRFAANKQTAALMSKANKLSVDLLGRYKNTASRFAMSAAGLSVSQYRNQKASRCITIAP